MVLVLDDPIQPTNMNHMNQFGNNRTLKKTLWMSSVTSTEEDNTCTDIAYDTEQSRYSNTEGEHGPNSVSAIMPIEHAERPVSTKGLLLIFCNDAIFYDDWHNEVEMLIQKNYNLK